MTLRATLLDTETFFDDLMVKAAPEGLAVIQDQHADTGGDIPFVSWTAINNGQYSHGLWSVTLTLGMVAEPLEMFGFATKLYAAIRTWEIPGEGVVAGLAGINTVTDGVVFDRVTRVRAHGKHYVQTAATFQLTVEDMS